MELRTLLKMSLSYTFHVVAVHSIDDDNSEHIARVSFRHSDDPRGETDISMNIRLHDSISGPYMCFRAGIQKKGESGNEGRRYKIFGVIFADNIRIRKLHSDRDRRPRLVPALQIRPLEIQRDATDILYEYLDNENLEFSQLHVIRMELRSPIDISMPDCLFKLTSPEAVAAIKELGATLSSYRKLTFVIQKNPLENLSSHVDTIWNNGVPRFIDSIQDHQRKENGRRPDVWIFGMQGQSIISSNEAAWDSFQAWDSRKANTNRRILKLPARSRQATGSQSKNSPKHEVKDEKQNPGSKVDDEAKAEQNSKQNNALSDSNEMKM